MKYEGAREVDDMAKFIAKHSTHEVAGVEVQKKKKKSKKIIDEL